MRCRPRYISGPNTELVVIGQQSIHFLEFAHVRIEKADEGQSHIAIGPRRTPNACSGSRPTGSICLVLPSYKLT